MASNLLTSDGLQPMVNVRNRQIPMKWWMMLPQYQLSLILTVAHIGGGIRSVVRTGYSIRSLEHRDLAVRNTADRGFGRTVPIGLPTLGL